MHLMRFAALLAALALSACGGRDSSTVPVAGTPVPGVISGPGTIGVPGATPVPGTIPTATPVPSATPFFVSVSPVAGSGVPGPQVRFVNGDFRVGTVDLTITPSTPSVPSIVANLPYALATGFFTTSVFTTVTVRSGPSGAVLVVCILPQLTNNTTYSVVIADRFGAPNCMLFVDANFTAAGQYRIHHSAADAVLSNFGVTNLAYGVSTSLGGLIVTEGVVPLGGFVIVQSVPTSALTTGNQAATGPGAIFAVMRTAIPGTVLVPLATLNLTSVFIPGTFVQPNSLGTLPFAPFVGISIYAIDCAGSAISALPGTVGLTCGPAGIALIGVFDTR